MEPRIVHVSANGINRQPHGTDIYMQGVQRKRHNDGVSKKYGRQYPQQVHIRPITYPTRTLQRAGRNVPVSGGRSGQNQGPWLVQYT
jgi:hypothetical protein